MGKTVTLMVVLMLIFMGVGYMVSGEEGMTTAFFYACGVNFFSYFFSDKLVLSHYKAVEVHEKNQPMLYETVKRLSQKAGLPMPKVYIIPEQAPNAFATGRNPHHAAVAATQGLLDLMTPEEVEGVLAHELSHVRHYDILIGTIAAALAGAIAMIGNMARYGASSRNNNNKGNALFVLIGAVLMPLAASVVQMSVSRTREYKADEGAAYLTNHPEWLMSALSKLEEYSKNYRMSKATAQTAHMFILNPFNGAGNILSNLFSTHPATKDRIKKLAEIQKKLS